MDAENDFSFEEAVRYRVLGVHFQIEQQVTAMADDIKGMLNLAQEALALIYSDYAAGYYRTRHRLCKRWKTISRDGR